MEAHKYTTPDLTLEPPDKTNSTQKSEKETKRVVKTDTHTKRLAKLQTKNNNNNEVRHAKTPVTIAQDHAPPACPQQPLHPSNSQPYV
jgi:hypothetical protein